MAITFPGEWWRWLLTTTWCLLLVVGLATRRVAVSFDGGAITRETWPRYRLPWSGVESVGGVIGRGGDTTRLRVRLNPEGRRAVGLARFNDSLSGRSVGVVLNEAAAVDFVERARARGVLTGPEAR